MVNPLTYVSLFSSAGLGCFGFKEAGFKGIATAELRQRRLEVQRVNEVAWRETGYVLGDLTEPETQQAILEEVAAWKELNCGSEITVVLATPPCQGMSVANHKKRDELPRNSLVVESLKLISQILPRFFVLENVRAFLTTTCLDLDGNQKSIREAIRDNLDRHYVIGERVSNLKEYGSPSSRTRTLVVGVRRDIGIADPFELFPARAQAPALSALIGDLPRLKTMGEYCNDDVYHAFRRYAPHMRDWIDGIGPGQSAFDNLDPSRRPHRIVEGERVENKASNGDKYRRARWEETAPCVHTRNDILASQTTVHPIDDRVFSIRELSRMMGVPDHFKWHANYPLKVPTHSDEKIRAMYAEHEVNIRQCLGEGVPTPVMQSVATKILQVESDTAVTVTSLSDAAMDSIQQQFQRANPRTRELSAYYTRQEAARRLVDAALPQISGRSAIRVLEPSVGAGAFLPSLLRALPDVDIELDIVDIDEAALANARAILNDLPDRSRVRLRSIAADFLAWKSERRYDLVVGNPPFGPGGRRGVDLSAEFVMRAAEIADVVAFVMPKALTSGLSYERARESLRAYALPEFIDFGEAAFSGIGIETVGIVVSTQKSPGMMRVTSDVLGQSRHLQQSYVVDQTFPTWLPYRNDEFDAFTEKFSLGMVRAVRDRSFSARQASSVGAVPVVGGRSIPRTSGQLMSAYGYIPEPGQVPSSWQSYKDADQRLVVPNLSYYPRGAELPHGWFADGSAAVMLPGQAIDVRRTLQLWASEEFFRFYRMARNFATRSLNVDRLSAHYWPVIIPGDPEVSLNPSSATSKDLFFSVF